MLTREQLAKIAVWGAKIEDDLHKNDMLLEPVKITAQIRKWISDYMKSTNSKSIIITNKYDIGADYLESICCTLTKYDTIFQDFTELNYTATDMAENIKAIIISPLNRTRARLIRTYHKYDDAADLYPFLDLYQSELYELGAVEGMGDKKLTEFFTQDDVEWADHEDIKTSIISSDEMPSTKINWFRYTLVQKQIIAKLHQREKATRHKAIIGRPFIQFK